MELDELRCQMQAAGRDIERAGAALRAIIRATTGPGLLETAGLRLVDVTRRYRRYRIRRAARARKARRGWR